MKNSYSTPPITRKTEYTFRKFPELKNATYSGTWMHGKMHGHGKIVWPSGEKIQPSYLLHLTPQNVVCICHLRNSASHIYMSNANKPTLNFDCRQVLRRPDETKSKARPGPIDLGGRNRFRGAVGGGQVRGPRGHLAKGARSQNAY